jgi:hypothetical protein
MVNDGEIRTVAGTIGSILRPALIAFVRFASNGWCLVFEVIGIDLPGIIANVFVTLT